MSETGEFRPPVSAPGSARASRPVAPVGSAQSGFTLIEALVVVTLTTLVALIGFPRLQDAFLTLTQHQTVAVVADRLRQARAEALRRDGPVIFAVAADGRSYGDSNGPVFASPLGVTLGVNAGAAGRITFYGDGSSSGGAVSVRAARRAITVRVAPLGGDVAVGQG